MSQKRAKLFRKAVKIAREGEARYKNQEDAFITILKHIVATNGLAKYASRQPRRKYLAK